MQQQMSAYLESLFTMAGIIQMEVRTRDVRARLVFSD